MITDNQVKKLKKNLSMGKSLAISALQAGMDEKTARKYRDLDKLPSELKATSDRWWRTHADPFGGVWGELEPFFETNPGLEAKTVFNHLQRQYPGVFEEGQLRTFQRRVKIWRVSNGPHREVFFPQVHTPGKLCQSDFTNMGKLNISIAGQPFDHLIYHFVLTYSNWETGSICFSESFESLSEGFQNALMDLGGVPEEHQTDRLSAAVRKAGSPEEFTSRYQALLNHYGINGRKTQPSSPNENGDVEQRNHRFKKALDQVLMLRGSRDFASRGEYSSFLRQLFEQLNSGRQKRFSEDQAALGVLPSLRLDACTKFDVKVGPSSTIRAKKNVYSVDSRLIGEMVKIRLYAEYLEVWHGQKCLETIPRLRGSSCHHIQYRHIIDWLVRKPGAFENYRYRESVFPTSRFRMAYDSLRKTLSVSGSAKEYLKILHLAARESEIMVDNALLMLIDQNKAINFESVENVVKADIPVLSATCMTVDQVCLISYDQLLQEMEVTL